MTKKEIINKMIEEGKSFEEIVIESKAAQSYVKTCLTKAGKNWEDSDDPTVELKTTIEETKNEESIPETEERDEKPEIQEPSEKEEEPVKEVIEDVEAFIKEMEAKHALDNLKRRRIQSVVRSLIIRDLKGKVIGSNERMITRNIRQNTRTVIQRRILKDLILDVKKYQELIK